MKNSSLIKRWEVLRFTLWRPARVRKHFAHRKSKTLRTNNLLQPSTKQESFSSAITGERSQRKDYIKNSNSSWCQKWTKKIFQSASVSLRKNQKPCGRNLVCVSFCFFCFNSVLSVDASDSTNTIVQLSATHPPLPPPGSSIISHTACLFMSQLIEFTWWPPSRNMRLGRGHL